MSLSNKLNGLREIWKFDNRFEIIKKRLAGEDQINYKINGLNIYVDHAAGDANGAREVLTSEMYRRFLPLINTTKSLNVLDIGANNGGFALLLRYENLPIKKFVGVEFNPSTFERLKRNVETNFEEPFELVNAAVCGEPRTVFATLENTGTSDSIYAEKKSRDGVEVPGMPLNQIISEYFGDDVIDICKMDVEGSEFEVFSNKSADKLSQVRHLILEIHHSQETPREPLIETIEGFGFEEVNIDNERRDDLHYVHLFRNKSLQ